MCTSLRHFSMKKSHSEKLPPNKHRTFPNSPPAHFPREKKSTGCQMTAVAWPLWTLMPWQQNAHDNESRRRRRAVSVASLSRGAATNGLAPIFSWKTLATFFLFITVTFIDFNRVTPWRVSSRAVRPHPILVTPLCRFKASDWAWSLMTSTPEQTAAAKRSEGLPAVKPFRCYGCYC